MGKNLKNSDHVAKLKKTMQQLKERFKIAKKRLTKIYKDADKIKKAIEDKYDIKLIEEEETMQKLYDDFYSQIDNKFWNEHIDNAIKSLKQLQSVRKSDHEDIYTLAIKVYNIQKECTCEMSLIL